MYLSHNHRAVTQVIKVGCMLDQATETLNLTSSKNELFLLGTIEKEYFSSQKRQKHRNTHQIKKHLQEEAQDLQSQPVP